MIPGKILTVPVETHPLANSDNWWFNKYYINCAYNKLKEIGLDINFNKHYSHGIEIRFFDHISQTDKLYESFEFVVYLMDVILDLEENNCQNNIPNPITNLLWNELVLGIMGEGNKYCIRDEIINLFNNMLDIKIEPNQNISPNQIYYQIYWQLKIKFNEVKFDNKAINLENQSSYQTTFIPQGKFSKLCLSQQQMNIKNKYIEEFVDKQIIKNTDLTNIEIKINTDNIINENNSCNSCCVIS